MKNEERKDWRCLPGKKWDGIEESKLMPFRMVDLEDLIYNNVLGLGFF
jgi:hypothetical protein